MNNNNQTKNNFPQELRCQICYHNYWTLEIKSEQLKINGKFCQPCAIKRIENFADWNKDKEKQIKEKRGWDLLLHHRSKIQ